MLGRRVDIQDYGAIDTEQLLELQAGRDFVPERSRATRYGVPGLLQDIADEAAEVDEMGIALGYGDGHHSDDTESDDYE
jgi:hypothetical protein